MTRSDPFNEGPVAAKARRRRNYAIALALIGFFLLVFVTTAVRLRQNIQAQSPTGAAPATAAAPGG